MAAFYIASNIKVKFANINFANFTLNSLTNIVKYNL